MEFDKVHQEKTEMQRHYVMYYEMSYGLNVEMHKQVNTRLDPQINNYYSYYAIHVPYYD